MIELNQCPSCGGRADFHDENVHDEDRARTYIQCCRANSYSNVSPSETPCCMRTTSFHTNVFVLGKGYEDHTQAVKQELAAMWNRIGKKCPEYST